MKIEMEIKMVVVLFKIRLFWYILDFVCEL